MKSLLGFDDMREVFGKYGLPMQEEDLAKTEDEAVRLSRRIGFPVLFKSLFLENQKKNRGTTLNSAEEVRSVFRKVQKTGEDAAGIIVQKPAVQGLEAIVRMSRDQKLGPIVTFGLSGIFAYLEDTSFRVAPVSEKEALKMIKEIKAGDILRGDRKRGPSDIRAISDVICGVSKLGLENDNILEIDINPLFAYEKGAVVVDARAVVI